MMDSPTEHWGIVGGGILGMTLAQRLTKSGRQVTLLEAAPEFGGLASAWEIGGMTWDRYYHVILLSDTRTRALIEELGLTKDLIWGETRTGFYTDGHLYSLSNALEFLRFPPLSLIDKFRLGWTIWMASRIRDGKALERIPVEAWLRRWSGSRTYEKIWKPLLKAKLGDRHTEASAAFLWAIIARLYAARRTGLKKEMFGYLKGGYGRILDRFVARLREQGAELRAAHPVRCVQPIPGGVRVDHVQGSEIFDRVVVTLPATQVLQILPGLTESEQARFAGIHYQGVLCASVLTRKPLAGFYVTNITDEAPYTGVIETTALVDRNTFGGHSLVYLPRYLAPHDPLFNASDEDISAQFLPALERMFPTFDRSDVVAFRVSRARHVLAIATLNYSDHLPPMQTSLPGVAVVNSAHIVNGTLNVNETIQLAEKAADTLVMSQSGKQQMVEASR